MDIFKLLDIKENNLYNEAFTHTSYANEKKCSSYERLEFLGDKVLDLIMSEYLYIKTNYEEGVMTKLRSKYVCEEALYEYAIYLNLNRYLKLGVGEEETGGRLRKAIVADIFESFIGALYLDKGLKIVKSFIYDYIIPLIEEDKISFGSDYKSMLQEYVQTDKRSLEYNVINEEGPSHNKMFTVVVKIDDITYGKGIAKSKKEAEQLAAKDALDKSK